MWVRKQKWLLGGLVASLILAGTMLSLWQKRQRSVFECRAEMQVFTLNSRADITLRYILDGTRGVVMLRGVAMLENGRPTAINHDVWFSFTQNGDDFFLRSEQVTSNLTGAAAPTGLSPVLPTFYLKAGEPFYLDILRLDGSNRLIFTNRVPSMLCKS